MIARMWTLIQRELWEHKALYVAPVVMAGLVIFGFVLSFLTAVFTGNAFEIVVATGELFGAPASLTGGGVLLLAPFAVLNLVLAAVVFFYSIDALYAERKDKSILFWRSLPITDTETVASKFATAIIAAPLITAVIMIATQVVLLLIATLVITLGGGNPVELLLGPLPFVQFWVLMTWIFITASLWFAPVIAWFLLCSAFAKRSVLIWVALPVIVLIMLEGIVMRGTRVARLLGERFSEASVSGLNVSRNFVDDEQALKALVMSGDLNVLGIIEPAQFLLAPGLWGGLVVAAVFGAGAVYCRRFRT